MEVYIMDFLEEDNECLKATITGVKIENMELRNRLTSVNDQLGKLEEYIGGTDDCVVEINKVEEHFEDNQTFLEEDLRSVKTENIELRNRIKSVIKELNNIVDVLSDQIYMSYDTVY